MVDPIPRSNPDPDPAAADPTEPEVSFGSTLHSLEPAGRPSLQSNQTVVPLLSRTSEPRPRRPWRYFMVHTAIPALVFAIWIALGLWHVGTDDQVAGDTAILKEPPLPPNVLTFITNIIAVDLNSLTLSLLWYPLDYGGCPPANNGTEGGSEAPVIDIFLDPTLIPGKAPANSSNADPGDPVYRLDVASFCNSEGSLYWYDLPVFQGDLRLVPWIPRISGFGENRVVTSQLSSVINYPLDAYHALVNLTAKHSATPEPLNIQMTVSALVPGFTVGTHYLSNRGDANYILSITLERSWAVQAYIFAVSLCEVLVTCILLALSLDFWLFGYKTRVEVLALPIATLFAFTQLRQTLPSVPSAETRLDFFVNLPLLPPLDVLQHDGDHHACVVLISAHRGAGCRQQLACAAL
ncbi:hypothetical protein MVEN_00869400 [Mycena venus]|uniref:Uncharacterized protein n=1 Tax=Mycena venus TaxID=2733690 RepID=A0A8H7D167_9AGAR|nr:hypothetical protein MVEN_00869400 [Mycena venus]